MGELVGETDVSGSVYARVGCLEIVVDLDPFISFDVVSYGAGLTKISVGKFALATGTGMMPLTFAFTYFGSVVSVGPAVTIATGVVLVALFFLIPRWIEKKDLLGLRHHFRHEKHQVLRS